MKFYKEKEFKDTEIGKIPKDWEVVRLGEIAQLQQGRTPPRNAYSNENGHRIIKVKDFTDGGVVNFEASGERCFTTLEFDSRYELELGDILVLSAAHSSGIVGQKMGYVATKPIKKAYFVAELIRIKAESSKVSSYLLFQSLNLQRSREQIKDKVKGGHLYPRYLAEIMLPLPPLSEQKRIAEILATVDSAIQKTEKVIEKTERLKRGLMQELLTKGIGHKEFKTTEIGKIPKDWQVVSVCEIFDVVTGTTPSTLENRYWEDGSIKWVTPLDLSKINGILYINDSQRKITPSALVEYNLTILPKGSIIISTRAPVGYVAVVGDEMTFNQGCKGLRKKGEFIKTEYFAYYFLQIRNILEQLSAGSTFKELSKTMLENLIVPYPPPSEQERIAEILSTVDRKIELERKRKEKLERIKKGLMDLLLTGKIRVKED
ncbi:restriction endonuclease subunit S [bacterium]|nr:restriction endonuclease subunit S [bacterium]